MGQTETRYRYVLKEEEGKINGEKCAQDKVKCSLV
jgi:hypothetical protein